MTEEKKTPEDQDQDRPEVEEVVTDFGDVRVRSGFEIKKEEPGVLGVNIFRPVFEFLGDDEDDDVELDEDAEDEEEHE